MPTVTSELLQHLFELPDRPERVVSLLSSATETLEVIGHGASIAGMSEYCSRYVSVDAPVVGRYTNANLELIKDLDPDLVLVTSGVQTPLARRFVDAGLPVYALELPASIHGALDNILRVSALMNAVDTGRSLVRDAERRLAACQAPAPPRTTYAEVWFGRHMRTVGGRSFISDMIEFAGGHNLFADSRFSYEKPALDSIPDFHPEVILGFSEPEYPIDFPTVVAEREWQFPHQLIISDITKGQNLIHDGPSMIDTIEWLAHRYSTRRT